MCKRLLLLSAVAACAVAACVSYDSKLKSWIGQPIEYYLQVSGRPPPERVSGPDARGHRVYVVKESEDADCIVFWEVDATGLMVAYRYEGRSCKHFTN